MHVRGNLHFSQSSQPTASQTLTTALEQCNIASQEPMVTSLALETSPPQPWTSSQQDTGEGYTQEGILWWVIANTSACLRVAVCV